MADTMANNDDSTCSATNTPASPQINNDTLDEKVNALQQKKRERAKGRWKILQKALLGHAAAAAATNQTPSGPHNNTNDSTDASTKNGEINSASIHRFPGFQIFQRNTVTNQDDDSNVKDIMTSHDGGGRDFYECVEYTVALLVPKDDKTHDPKEENKEELFLKFRTRERIPQSRSRGDDGKMDLTSLISHRVHGVDNTGNAKVWNSESVLAHCLLRGGPPQSSHASTSETTSMRNNIVLPFGLENVMNLGINPEGNEMNHPLPLRVVELGAGMAGLAGLSLAAANMQPNTLGPTAMPKRGIEVLLTDGHPDCVENNRISSLLTMSLHNNNHDSMVWSDNTTTILKSMRLLWKDNAQGAQECTNILAGTSGFHLCLASDCVHFQEFHAALAITIGRLLCVGGICILCQPPRGNSLQRFMALVQSMGTSFQEEKDETEAISPTPLFTMHEWDRYDAEITRQHDDSLASSKMNDNGYDPNIHYPHMLLLRKEREYDERFTEDAVKYQQERGNDYI